MSTEDFAHLDSKVPHRLVANSPDSVPVRGPLPQIPLVVNLPDIPHQESPAPVQAKEEIPIAKAENTIDTKMDNMMKSFQAWTFQIIKLNETWFRWYQNGRPNTNAADYSPTYTPINFPPPNAPMEYNFQQHPWWEIGWWINGNEQRHIHTFCPYMPTDQEECIVHVNKCGRLTWGPSGGCGEESFGYGLETSIILILMYTREVA